MSGSTSSTTDNMVVSRVTDNTKDTNPHNAPATSTQVDNEAPMTRDLSDEVNGNAVGTSDNVTGSDTNGNAATDNQRKIPDTDNSNERKIPGTENSSNLVLSNAVTNANAPPVANVTVHRTMDNTEAQNENKNNENANITQNQNLKPRQNPVQNVKSKWTQIKLLGLKKLRTVSQDLQSR